MAKRQAREQAVEDRLDHVGGDRLQDAVLRTEARHHVAKVTRLEVRRWQVDQVAEQVGAALHLERRAEHDDDPAAHRRDDDAQQHQQAKAERQHEQQVAVGRDQRMVDHPLHEQRAHDREHLDRQRQQEQLAERPPQADHVAEHRTHAHARRRLRRLHLADRRQFQRDPGEMLGHHAPSAAGARRRPGRGSRACRCRHSSSTTK